MTGARPVHRAYAVALLLPMAAMLVAGLASPEPQAPDASSTGAPDAPRFAWVDVFLDSGRVPLAAYQLELSSAAGTFRIVGIEGGEHEAFATPPYYDPSALQNDRVILAAFSLADELPTGRSRVARVHVMIEGAPPQYEAALVVAADAEGRRIPAQISMEEGAES